MNPIRAVVETAAAHWEPLHTCLLLVLCTFLLDFGLWEAGMGHGGSWQNKGVSDRGTEVLICWWCEAPRDADLTGRVTDGPGEEQEMCYQRREMDHSLWNRKWHLLRNYTFLRNKGN